MTTVTLEKTTDLGTSSPMDITDLEVLTPADKWLLWYNGSPVVCENILKMFKTYIVEIEKHLGDDSKIGDDIKQIITDMKNGDNDVNQLYFKLYTPPNYQIEINSGQKIGPLREVNIDGGQGKLKDYDISTEIGKFLNDPLVDKTKFDINIKFGSHYTTPQGCVCFNVGSNKYYFTINNPGLNKLGIKLNYIDLTEYFNIDQNAKNNKMLSNDPDVLFGGSRKKRKSKSKSKPRKAKSQKKTKPKPKRSKKSKRKKSSKK